MAKLDRTLDSVDKGVNRLQIGCLAIFINLFLSAFCVWGMYAAYSSWRLQSMGEVTQGVVIEMEESTDSEGSCCVYSPVIEFQSGGQSFTFDGANASDPPAYQMGEQVRVRYDPADPTTAQIDRFSERWLFPILIIPSMSLTLLVINFFIVRAFLRGEHIQE